MGTLVCDEEKQVKAHKVILSSSSEVFRKILITNPHRHPLLYLKGISYKDLQAAVKFLYFGEAEIAQDDLQTFLATAKELKIEGLMDNESKNSIRDHASETYHINYETKYESNHSVVDIDKFDNYQVTLTSSEPFENDFSTNSVNDKVGHFFCNECEKTFTQPGTLNRHKKTVHGGVRYSCEQCEKEFSQSGDLSKHI